MALQKPLEGLWKGFSKFTVKDGQKSSNSQPLEAAPPLPSESSSVVNCHTKTFLDLDWSNPCVLTLIIITPTAEGNNR